MGVIDFSLYMRDPSYMAQTPEEERYGIYGNFRPLGDVGRGSETQQVRYHVNKYYRIYIFTGYRTSYANI